ncbi:LysR family transcriptional regulator [Virgisporangium ochraceum]|uniref:LysR family transcriptional regulator n=1 Tax=Virgisporangium ochraceum TaxID=65505 RepID=A0A8J3ZSM4_9ACTN|nr:LysR family transcriptional regulator [Virgisporangium ochraceum]GIJ66741.1 LysR family transcriptional regulator [Virgisporangium ochraceum]
MDLLAHLAAFVAVADEASFSRAADRLGIAQPLLSRRVRTLEEHFGGPLFDRSPRRVSTTDFGQLLLPYAHDVLDRTQRLRQVARSARESAARAVGVPADCDPAALAAVIRAGAEHDVTLGLSELSPEAREAGVADGSLAFALVRVPPESAPLRVPLGLASATARERPIHLEDLRPRRGSGRPVPVLVTAEDDVPHARDRLARAAARAGLPESRFRPAGTNGTAAAALAETLAGRSLLLCAAPFARRHGAAWAPLADTALHRGYALTAAATQRAGVPGWLVRPLAVAVGARRTATPPRDAVRADARDAGFRLAARG